MVTRLLRLRRETDGLTPCRRPGQPAVLGTALDAGIMAQLQTTPDATIDEHRAAWEASIGTRVSPARMRRAVRRLGWTRKKARPVNSA